MGGVGVWGGGVGVGFEAVVGLFEGAGVEVAIEIAVAVEVAPVVAVAVTVAEVAPVFAAVAAAGLGPVAELAQLREDAAAASGSFWPAEAVLAAV